MSEVAVNLQVTESDTNVSVTSAAGGSGQAVSVTSPTVGVNLRNASPIDNVEYQVDGGSWLVLPSGLARTVDIDLSASALKLRLAPGASSPVPVVLTSKVIAGGPGAGASSTSGGPVTVDSSRAVTAADNGRTLVLSAAATLTVGEGLPAGFGFAVKTPASGNASIAKGGTVTLNGAATTLTRSRASNPTVFAVVQTGANAYDVTGS